MLSKNIQGGEIDQFSKVSIVFLQAELETDIFSLYDVDGNGYIEFKEFLLIVTMMSEGTAQTKLQQIFKFV